jgi:exopolysaccharide biosynthesis polyprenyl glycosylphosphotransferase
MIKQQVYIINTILMVLDACCVVSAGYGAYFIKYFVSFQYMGYRWGMETEVFVGSVMLVMFLNNYLLGQMDLYGDRQASSVVKLMGPIFSAIIVDFGVLSAAVFMLQMKTYSRLFLIAFVLLSFLLIALNRIAFYFYFTKISKKGFSTRKIIIVGNADRARLVQNVLEKQMSWGHNVVGRLYLPGEKIPTQNALGSIVDLSHILQTFAIDEVVFALDRTEKFDLTESIDACRKIGAGVKILPALWNEGEHQLSTETFQTVPFLTMQCGRFDASGLMYKRMLDLTGGLFGFIIFILVYPFVAVAIKLESKGPVLFKQKRIGQRGRIFNLYKFRSMYQDAETKKKKLLDKNVMNGAMFKIKDDPRITRVGRWLRTTSFDELPQMINVIKGEMSLVGTRPPTLDEVAQYEVEHLRRISAKPGVTGLWQISGRNKITDFEKIVELDCKYLDEWRFSYDIKILFKTIIVLVQRKGAM